jgi:hypothetical protein
MLEAGDPDRIKGEKERAPNALSLSLSLSLSASMMSCSALPCPPSHGGLSEMSKTVNRINLSSLKLFCSGIS